MRKEIWKICERERGKKTGRGKGRGEEKGGGGPILIFSSFPTGFSCREAEAVWRRYVHYACSLVKLAR